MPFPNLGVIYIIGKEESSVEVCPTRNKQIFHDEDASIKCMSVVVVVVAAAVVIVLI